MIQISFKKTGFNQDLKSDVKAKISPLPQTLIESTGCVVLDGNVKITVKGQDMSYDQFPKLLESLDSDYMIEPDWSIEEFCAKVEFWLNLRLSELQSKFTFETTQFSASSEVSDLMLPSENIPREGERQGYYLKASPQGIELQAYTMHGAFYGIVTLMQMLSIENQISEEYVICPSVEMYDYPQYKVRGLVDDISRGQRPTIDNFKEFIQFLSRSKQNLLVIYIEDIFAWEKYPQIGEGRGPLTKEDIKEIQAYAKEWFVTIVPGVEMLGHMDNMLTDPDLMQYAEFPGAQCLNVSDPKTREFVKDLLAEIAPVFDSPLFAPICDESFDFGIGLSKEYVDKMGWGEALAEWYLFLIEEIKNLGKKMVLFAHDILYKSKKVMQAIQQQDAVVYFWDYSDKKQYKTIDKLRNEGLTVVGGPAVFDWSRHFPYYDYAETNMIYMGKDGLSRGLVGLVTTKWGDFFNENFRNNIFYGLAINGQAAWSPLQSEVPQIRSAYTWNFFGAEDPRPMECLNILSKQNIQLPRWPNGMFNRFWLDPFVREIKPKEHTLAKQFIEEGLTIAKTLAKLREDKILRIHEDNLDYMAYSAKMALHFGVKVLISEASYRNQPELAVFVQNHLGYEGDAILGGFKWLDKNIEQLQEEYQGLWLRLAVKEGLEYPTQRFQILQWHYQQAIDDLSKNIKPHTHQLKSEWIWRDGKRTSSTWGNSEWYYFVKSFDVSQKVKKATLQGIAANHLELGLNGNEVGRVLSRFSLSQFPMAKAVQWFDVTNLVHEGTNLLCVQGVNWTLGVGGINVILHLEFEDGSGEDIMSDGSWQFTFQKPTTWPLEDIEQLKNLALRPVRSYGKPPGNWQGPITEPVWEKGWKSSISFIFGNRNFIDTSISTQVGRGLYKALFWLVPAGGRFFSEDMYVLREEN